MAKSRDQKKQLVAEYKELLQNSDGFVAVENGAMSASSASQLKIKLKRESAIARVVKNSLFKIAIDDLKMPVELKDFQGSVLITFYKVDPVTPAKILADSIKDNDQVDFKFGWVDGTVLNSDRVKVLSTLPSKEELLAKMLGSSVAPIKGFMTVSNGPLTGFVRILSELASK